MRLNGTLLALALIGLTALVTPALAAGDLAGAVPADAVAVVRVTGLQTQWTLFFDSATWKRIEQSPFPDIADGISKARQGIAAFEQQTSLNVENCIGSIFGTDFLLGMLPDKKAFFVARTPDLEKLSRTIDLIHTLENNDGKLLRQSVESYQGAEIHTDVLTNPAQPGAPEKQRHYVQTGDLLIASEDLSAVHRVLDVTSSKSPSLATAAKYIEASKSLRPGAVVRLYVDGAGLAKAVDLESALDGQMQNLVVRMIARRVKQILPATQYIVADAAAAGDRLEVRYVMACDEQKLPEVLRASPGLNAPLDVMRLVPPTALVAYGAQFSKPALWRFVVESVREADSSSAETLISHAKIVGAAIGGMDFEKDLLPQFGDQDALIVTPGANQNPPSVSLVLEMKDPASIATALKTLAGTATTVSTSEAEKTGIPPTVVLNRTTYHDAELTTMELKEAKFDGKLNPTLCVTGKYLVLSTTPEAARLILDAAAAPSAAKPEALRASGFLDLNGIAAVLGQYRDFLIRKSIADGKPEVQARKDQMGLEFLLSLARRIDVRSAARPGRIERTLLITF